MTKMARIFHVFEQNARATRLLAEVFHVCSDALAENVVPKHHDEFLAIREDLFLRMMDAVAASGTAFAAAKVPPPQPAAPPPPANPTTTDGGGQR